MKANGTIAKDIAIYFFEAINTRCTSSMIAKTIIQAKHLLEAGYTEEEIKKVIDYIVNKTNVNMYSLGYVNTMINRILEDIEEEEKEEKREEVKEKLKKEYESMVFEVVDNDASKTRNREKLSRFGLKSRFGKEFDFDMLEESGEDN